MPSAARRIREVRKLLGLRQEDFAAHLGVSQTSVSRWEKGVQEPDFMTMYNIGKLAGVDPMKFAMLDADHEFGGEISPNHTQIVGAISSTTEVENPRWEHEDRVSLSFPLDIPEGYLTEAYIVKDDSEEPRYPKGTIIFSAIYDRSRNFYPKNNDVCVCFVRSTNKLWRVKLYTFRWERGGRVSLTGLKFHNGALDSWDVDAATVIGTVGTHAWPGAFKDLSIVGVVIASFIIESPDRLGPLDAIDRDAEDTPEGT